MKGGGTGRRGERNLSVQKESVCECLDREEVGVSPERLLSRECKRADLLRTGDE